MSEPKLDEARAIIAAHERKEREDKIATLGRKMVGKYFKHRLSPSSYGDRAWRYFAVSAVSPQARPVGWAFRHDETECQISLTSERELWEAQDWIEINADEFWLAASEVLHRVRDLMERRRVG